jgi:hypothetical protein
MSDAPDRVAEPEDHDAYTIALAILDDVTDSATESLSGPRTLR